MALMKQKTVSRGGRSETIELHRLKNTMDRGGKWMYEIRDSGGVIQGGFTNKQNALSDFRTAVGDTKQAFRGQEIAEKKEEKRSGGALLGKGAEDDILGNL